MMSPVLPALGPVYRDRRDGTVAGVIAGPNWAGSMLIRTAAGDRLWLHEDKFWHRYVHQDLYATDRN